MEQNNSIAHTPAICHDHANELRRMARKIGHPAGDVPAVMHAAARRIEELERTWIDPNDKAQKQYLPWIGEKVLFCHAGITYYGRHTGGGFQSFNPPKQFNTWSCRWMYPPKAAEPIQRAEAGGGK